MNELYFTIDGQKIFFTLRKRRYQRQINFIVHQDNSLVVTAPKTCTQKTIKKEMLKNKKWLLKYLKNQTHGVTVDECVVTHIKKALKPIIEAKLLQFNSYYNFDYKRVTLRHQKTRWGSCSSKGNLNFNCKLFCLPQELIDYVVVHELCHLKEMNHSKEFWNLVEQTIPNYKELRKRLKRQVV